MTQHTPGPWTVEMINNDAARIWGPNNTFVAECWRPHGKAYPTKANANLIAAAPELLEALEECLDSWQYGESTTEGKTAYDKAREAIIIAKGAPS